MTVEELVRRPVSALVSFHYYPSPEQVGRLYRGGLRMIADSGAFSAMSLGKTVTLDAFAKWAHDVEPYTLWTAGLDVIGDAAGTWDNWTELRRQGLDVVPTVHYGAAPSELDRYVEQGVDFIGLGGMVGRKSEPDRLLRWALSMMRHAQAHHPELRFHGWGISHPRLVMNLPWWSVDSSGFGSAYRFGRVRLFDPATRKQHGADLDGQDVYRLGRLLRTHYGTEPAAIERSSAANRRLVIYVSVRSIQLLEDYLRGRHKVTAPTYGVRHHPWPVDTPPKPEGGTHVHFADAGPHILAELLVGTHIHAALTNEERQLVNDEPALEATTMTDTTSTTLTA